MSERPWKFIEGPAEGSIDVLSARTGLSQLVVRVCLQRGLNTEEEIQRFISPRLDQLTDPFTIQDMRKAAARVALAKETGEHVRVFGDYDVDGTTGAALLGWIFRDLGYRFSVKQPDRFKDGYGLNVNAVEEAAREGVRILVTVDCGITSFEPIARAHELGLDVVVIDHHQVDPVKGLPQAYAVVNPQRADCASGLKMLCGCGLAFYFSMALRSIGRERGWFEQGVREPHLRQHLDLVVIATAADQVPLIGVNRVLVAQGMEVLRNSAKPGVRALMDVAGLNKRAFGPSSLGFVLGPRINASGRMASAQTALEMLMERDSGRAARLAWELERLNKERGAVQDQIWDEVRARVEAGIKEGQFKYGVAIADPGWHEGVVGIVASRVTETFHKPAAVIAIREDGIGKGSVRSFAGKDVLEALRRSAEHLLGFGGHVYAAGLSLKAENVEAFARSFDEALSQLSEKSELKPIWLEGECSVEELTVETIRELEKLGPFGPGNPEPMFAVRAKVGAQRLLKDRHLKINLSSIEDGRDSREIEGIWFHAADRSQWFDAEKGRCNITQATWAGVPELNHFQGRVTPTLRIKDLRI